MIMIDAGDVYLSPETYRRMKHAKQAMKEILEGTVLELYDKKPEFGCIPAGAWKLFEAEVKIMEESVVMLEGKKEYSGKVKIAVSGFPKTDGIAMSFCIRKKDEPEVHLTGKTWEERDCEYLPKLMGTLRVSPDTEINIKFTMENILKKE